jgi:hypothetical protein
MNQWSASANHLMVRPTDDRTDAESIRSIWNGRYLENSATALTVRRWVDCRRCLTVFEWQLLFGAAQ